MNTDFIKEQIKKQLPIELDILKETNAILAGGALTSLYTRKEINDFDIYFPNMDAYMEALSSVVEEHGFVHVLAKTNKAIMFCTKIGGVAVQFIYDQFYSTAEDIFSSFDFYINMAAYNFKDDTLILHDKFLPNLAARSLEFNTNTKYPIISALRVDKYKQRGYDITKKEFLKVMLSVNKLGIKDWKDFKEQLSGLYGEKLSLIINEEEEFSVTRGLELLEEVQVDVYNASYNIESNQEADVRDIVEKWRIDKTTKLIKDTFEKGGAKFYKTVDKSLKESHYSRPDTTYTLGSIINGTIYARLKKDISFCAWSSQGVVELTPKGNVSFDNCIGEVRLDKVVLTGEWEVTGVWTKEEWENNKS